jgi:hypothetical protein
MILEVYSMKILFTVLLTLLLTGCYDEDTSTQGSCKHLEFLVKLNKLATDIRDDPVIQNSYVVCDIPIYAFEELDKSTNEVVIYLDTVEGGREYSNTTK